MVVRGGFAGRPTVAGAAGWTDRNGKMTMRLAPCLAAVLALSACAQTPPDDRLGGVGFESYADYQRRREAELLAQRQAPQTVLPPAAGATSGGPVTTGGAIASGPIGQVEPAPPPLSGAPVHADSDQVPPAALLPEETPNNAGISDEQDFSAVAGRETIESDKERLARNRAQYEQVVPQPLPPRVTDTGTGIIAYALSAPNRLGETIYKRSGISLGNSASACARYPTPEAAQEAFLKAGGPKRDRRNLDPDGDGFACAWDPTPFQKARG